MTKKGILLPFRSKPLEQLCIIQRKEQSSKVIFTFLSFESN